ncbi:hypothetical protein I3842_13G175600 [Carya illinoinensis]|uniref:NADH dehydrogenase subunit 4 n=1 Tax=Carya illinoinensis TaxID=32201 RepID=A0A922IUA5_CARIL|nr:hypothetical protein I3842_13G175600 [Carya illinoinensis]
MNPMLLLPWFLWTKLSPGMAKDTRLAIILQLMMIMSVYYLFCQGCCDQAMTQTFLF